MPFKNTEIVARARELERLMLRRRVALKKVRELDERIRVARKLLADLTRFEPGDLYQPPIGDEGLPGAPAAAPPAE